MATTYKVLIIDDHPIIADAYKSAFEFISNQDNEVEFKIALANNCDSAIEKINQISKNNGFDIVFLDISLPASSDGEYLSGEDLGVQLRKVSQDCKIIVATTFNDNYRIQTILQNVNPDGFLIKNDITKDELVAAIKAVMNGTPYYSKSVLQLFRKQGAADFKLDKIDRQILYEMSIGTKMKDLPSIVPLSLAGIEKRKKNLKLLFDVDVNDDRALILKAKEKGFI